MLTLIFNSTVALTALGAASCVLHCLTFLSSDQNAPFFLSDSLLAFKPEEMTDEELNLLLEQLEETDLKAAPGPETPESDPEAAGKVRGWET